ncbi:unnamed protein product, partial [Symbiodinium pilosum]
VLAGFLSFRIAEAWLSSFHQLHVAALVFSWCFPDTDDVAGLRVFGTTWLQVVSSHLGSATCAALRSAWVAGEAHSAVAFLLCGGFSEVTMGAAPFVEVFLQDGDFRPAAFRTRRKLEGSPAFLQRFLGLGAFLEAAGAMTAAAWAFLVVVFCLESQHHSDAGAYVESGTVLAALSGLMAMALAKACIRVITAPMEVLLYCAVLRERSCLQGAPQINVEAVL